MLQQNRDVGSPHTGQPPSEAARKPGRRGSAPFVCSLEEVIDRGSRTPRGLFWWQETSSTLGSSTTSRANVAMTGLTRSNLVSNPSVTKFGVRGQKHPPITHTPPPSRTRQLGNRPPGRAYCTAATPDNPAVTALAWLGQWKITNNPHGWFGGIMEMGKASHE